MKSFGQFFFERYSVFSIIHRSSWLGRKNFSDFAGSGNTFTRPTSSSDFFIVFVVNSYWFIANHHGRPEYHVCENFQVQTSRLGSYIPFAGDIIANTKYRIIDYTVIVNFFLLFWFWFSTQSDSDNFFHFNFFYGTLNGVTRKVNSLSLLRNASVLRC